MKAVLYHKYGNTDELKLQDIEKPVPGDNQILIKVYAVSINDWDLGLLNGTPFVNRIINGLIKPKQKILGSDIAGVIESTGNNVKRYKAGDEVFGDISGQWGGFAEYVCTEENSICLKPESMSFEEAAAIPQAGMLAVQGLIDKGCITHGQKVLINGAGGGVGTFAAQIAKQYGVELTGVDVSDKFDIMREVGFHYIIDYTKEDFTKNGLKYDVIIDNKFNRFITHYLHSLKKNGIYVILGGSLFRLFTALLLSPLIKLFSGKQIKIVDLKPNKDLDYIKKLFESGKMKPIIDGHFSLKKIQKAFKHYKDGDFKGKLVISVNSHK